MTSAIKIEIDGPGVSPSSVDATTALELAASLLGLMQKLASDRGQALSIRGLSIEDKCMAVVAHVDRAPFAKDLAREALGYIHGDPAPRGAGVFADRARSVLQRLPENQSAAVILGRWKRPLRRDEAALERSPWARISQRARLVRLGGQSATARFDSRYEGEFSLSLSVDEAKRLARHLYSDLDIEARVVRDEEGVIERGVLVGWQQLSDEDPSVAMREWFAENALTVSEFDALRGIRARRRD